MITRRGRFARWVFGWAVTAVCLGITCALFAAPVIVLIVII